MAPLKKDDSIGGVEELNIKTTGSSDAPVPVPRILQDAFLVAKVHVREAVALAVSVGPFEIVQ